MWSFVCVRCSIDVVFFLMIRRPPRSTRTDTLVPYTTRFRSKGELEEAIAALDYPALVLVRPGLIDGERSERRPAEAAALLVSRALRPLLPAKWRPSQIGRAHV